MGILNNIIKGASSQFGREFGRAGANYFLKGANGYTINSSSSSHDGRIKPSDSDLVKSIKTLKKLTFVTTDKGNITRLIEMTNEVMEHSKFNGVDTLINIGDYKTLFNLYNQKNEHGDVMISDDSHNTTEYKFLISKREEFELSIETFNAQLNEFITAKQVTTTKKKKSKTITLILSGILFIGLHNLYLGNIKKFFWGVVGLIVPVWNVYRWIKNIVNFFKILFMSTQNFNIEFNSEYAFYNQFKL